MTGLASSLPILIGFCTLPSLVTSVCYDERLTVESYSGILYPSDTKVLRRQGHCLTSCSMNRSCAAVYYDELNQLCYRSNVSAVYNIYNADTYGTNSALAKRVLASNIDVLSVSIIDSAAQGKTVHLNNISDRDNKPLSRINDGLTSKAFISNNFPVDDSDKGFTLDLNRVRDVIGVSIMACREDVRDPPMNNFKILVQSESGDKRNLCLAAGDKTAEYGDKFTKFFCDDGDVRGRGLPNDLIVQQGRYVSFLCDSECSLTYLCMREFKVITLM